jgi:hypothetical protein
MKPSFFWGRLLLRTRRIKQMKITTWSRLALPALLLGYQPATAWAEDDKWTRNLSIHGLIEVEYSVGDDFGDASVSDVTLATMELGLEAKVNDMISANVTFLEEDDDTDNQVDQAYLTYTNPKQPELTFMAGRLYVPFGVFESHTVSDPLVLEVGETQESALQLDYDAGEVGLSFYLFNGVSNESSNSGDDKAEQFGFNVNYGMKKDDAHITARFGYISSIADADAFADLPNVDTLDSYVAGVNLHLGYARGPVSVNLEYVGANSKFDVTELDYKGDGAQPTAYLLDVGYDTEVAGKPATLGISLQGTEDALGLPEERLALSLSMDVMENASLGFEWTHDKDYDTSASSVVSGLNGSGKTADLITVQLATQF